MDEPGTSSAGQWAHVVECPICYSVYDKPMQMGCGHTLCSSCIGRLVDQVKANMGIVNDGRQFDDQGPFPQGLGADFLDDQQFIELPPLHQRDPQLIRGIVAFPRRRVAGIEIKCPECRKPTVVPADGLPVNYRVQEIVQKVAHLFKDRHLVKHCSQCEEVLAQGVYFDCAQCDSHKICSTCAIRSHNGHPIVEKKAMTAKDVLQMKEKICDAAQTAYQAYEIIKPKLQAVGGTIEVKMNSYLTKVIGIFDLMCNTFDSKIKETTTTDELEVEVKKAEEYAQVFKNSIDVVNNQLLPAIENAVTAFWGPFELIKNDMEDKMEAAGIPIPGGRTPQPPAPQGQQAAQPPGQAQPVAAGNGRAVFNQPNLVLRNAGQQQAALHFAQVHRQRQRQRLQPQVAAQPQLALQPHPHAAIQPQPMWRPAGPGMPPRGMPGMMHQPPPHHLQQGGPMHMANQQGPPVMHFQMQLQQAHPPQAQQQQMGAPQMPMPMPMQGMPMNMPQQPPQLQQRQNNQQQQQHQNMQNIQREQFQQMMLNAHVPLPPQMPQGQPAAQHQMPPQPPQMAPQMQRMPIQQQQQQQQQPPVRRPDMLDLPFNGPAPPQNQQGYYQGMQQRAHQRMVQGPMQGPMQGQQVPMHGIMQGPMQGPVQGPMHVIRAPIQAQQVQVQAQHGQMRAQEGPIRAQQNQMPPQQVPMPPQLDPMPPQQMQAQQNPIPAEQQDALQLQQQIEIQVAQQIIAQQMAHARADIAEDVEWRENVPQADREQGFPFENEEIDQDNGNQLQEQDDADEDVNPIDPIEAFHEANANIQHYRGVRGQAQIDALQVDNVRHEGRVRDFGREIPPQLRAMNDNQVMGAAEDDELPAGVDHHVFNGMAAAARFARFEDMRQEVDAIAVGVEDFDPAEAEMAVQLEEDIVAGIGGNNEGGDAALNAQVEVLNEAPVVPADPAEQAAAVVAEPDVEILEGDYVEEVLEQAPTERQTPRRSQRRDMNFPAPTEAPVESRRATRSSTRQPGSNDEPSTSSGTRPRTPSPANLAKRRKMERRPGVAVAEPEPMEQEEPEEHPDVPRPPKRRAASTQGTTSSAPSVPTTRRQARS